ncbi:MAG: zinc dependent phospholipase C family protein [Clostridiales bacterium]|nr:zinc dependent phospholipase C family protein [Clostridiales bacterium]
MRKKSHISLAVGLMDKLQLEDTMNHKLTFCFGSILPDCKPSFLTTPHTFKNTFEDVKQKIERFIEKMKNMYCFGYRDCIRLGEITHYLADYFTFPHNEHYEGNLKEHCYYEKDLKFALRRFLESKEVMEIRREIKVHTTKEELFQFIEETHQEYTKKKSIVLEDCRYIVRVCMEVVASVVAILQNSFVEMREVLAQPV